VLGLKMWAIVFGPHKKPGHVWAWKAKAARLEG